MNSERKTLSELIALRRQILESGDGWRDLCERQIENMTRSLERVESEIVASPCNCEDDKLRLLSILLDSDDAPGFADDFKNSVFSRLRTQWSKARQPIAVSQSTYMGS
jgi:hypothetical protein